MSNLFNLSKKRIVTALALFIGSVSAQAEVFDYDPINPNPFNDFSTPISAVDKFAMPITDPN